MDSNGISIIIPVYNTAPYLRHCIDTVLSQDFNNYEIIIIDDGSTDSSSSILKEYAISNNSIKLLTQENSGQAIARNNGMRHATGRYVVFIDSDDWMSSQDALSKMYKEISETGADFVQCGLSFVNDKKESIYRIQQKSSVTGKQILIDMLNVNNLYTSPWAKIYSKDFLAKNNLYFPERIVNEDTAFSIMIAAMADKVAFLDDCVYCSREREGSTSRASFKRMFQSMDISLNLTQQFLIDHNLFDNQIQQLYEARYVRSMLYNILQAAQRLDFHHFIDDYQYCLNNTLYQRYLESAKWLTIKHRLMTRLSKNPIIIFSAMRILNFASIKMH